MKEDPVIPEISAPQVREVFESAPEKVRKNLHRLRAYIIEVAQETDEIGELEETLKWGEPSYIAKRGSTIRLGWSSENETQVFLYFHCQTKLVDTFRQLYSEQLAFQGNRAVVLDPGFEQYSAAIKHCIQLGLTYHRVKHLPLLGA